MYINLNYVHAGYNWYLHNWPMLILATYTLIQQVQTTMLKASWQENFPFESPSRTNGIIEYFAPSASFESMMANYRDDG